VLDNLKRGVILKSGLSCVVARIVMNNYAAVHDTGKTPLIKKG
jgi:hypothetical protein